MRYARVIIRHREYRDDGVFISSPKCYCASVQTPSNYRDIQAYGERITEKKKVIIRNRLVIRRTCDEHCVCEISDGDLAYVNTTPKDEVEAGEKADYVVESILVGNEYCTIILNRIIK